MSLDAAINDQRGASAIEYTVLIALIASVIMVTVAFLGKNTRIAFDDINTVFPAEKKGKCKDSPGDPDCGHGND